MTGVLVTGGAGFIGSALVRRLVRDGFSVRVLDNESRGAGSRLTDVRSAIDFIVGDIRDEAVVRRAVDGVRMVHHLAYVNGTENFYKHPDLVLDIAIRGMINVLRASTDAQVKEFYLASTSEVYQQAEIIPTDETVALSVPDPLNPRYSYGGGKIACELMALHMLGDLIPKVTIYRPHNIYGPAMGWEHVIPQFASRLFDLTKGGHKSPLPFAIQGDGQQTRSFCHIDDFIDGVLMVQEKGRHREIYHIGTEDEVTIATLARKMAEASGLTIELKPGLEAKGGTPRRCPSIVKMRGLGYKPRISLDEGLRPVLDWYWKQLGESSVLRAPSAASAG